MRYEHGTLGGNKIDGCKCDACRAADRRYMNRRARLMAYGQWQPYVDATPVREHVRRLQDFGVGWMTLAKLAGVPRGSVSKLLYGDGVRGLAPSKRVRPATAAALLAVEPSMDVLADGAMVDGTGTRRRLQALVAIGWSQRRLAERLGVRVSNLNKTLRGDTLVLCRTARAVRAVYDDLWDQAPPQGEHREKIAANRARNYARDRGWAPPLAWDDDTIDDPRNIALVAYRWFAAWLTATCTTPCDADCVELCHEVHKADWVRAHTPQDCPSARIAGEVR